MIFPDIYYTIQVYPFIENFYGYCFFSRSHILGKLIEALHPLSFSELLGFLFGFFFFLCLFYSGLIFMIFFGKKLCPFLCLLHCIYNFIASSFVCSFIFRKLNFIFLVKFTGNRYRHYIKASMINNKTLIFHIISPGFILPSSH